MAETLTQIAILRHEYIGRTDVDEFFARALTILEAQLDENHSLVHDSRRNLAEIYVEQGRHEESAVLWLKILAWENEYYAADDPRRTESVEAYAGVLGALGRQDKAAGIRATLR